jgi:hypothetical protein
MAADRKTILRAVADRAHSNANDGESAPDYRWMDSYIDEACNRYSVTLTPEERRNVERMVRNG